MAWVLILLAGICELGWPLGLKLGWTEQGLRPIWIVFVIVCILVRGGLLLLAQREIAIGLCRMDRHRRSGGVPGRRVGVRRSRNARTLRLGRSDRSRHHRTEDRVTAAGVDRAALQPMF